MIATPEPGRVDAERELVTDRTDEPAAGLAAAGRERVVAFADAAIACHGKWLAQI